jgi:membrane peptidoglycan carboxypeptidase
VLISGRAAARRAKTHHRWRRVALLALLLSGCMVVAVVIAGAVLLAAVPGVGDAQGRVAAVLREHGGRSVALPLPSRVAESVVAVEDRRFYAHHGVDPQSVVRVVWAGLRGRGWQDQGGSTITQQLAKRVYTGDRGGLLGTLEQVGLAIKLERRYSKAQILQMYLDSVYFGDGHWGIVQASEGYFGKPPARLSWGEASLLAGLVQAPSAYDPKVHLAAAEHRQRHVLDRLVAAGTLRRAQADAASRRLAGEASRLGFTSAARSSLGYTGALG